MGSVLGCAEAAHFPHKQADLLESSIQDLGTRVQFPVSGYFATKGRISREKPG
ncbi:MULTISPECIES: hypothetical protein [unclassified Microcoleus]|uniref:hypothetical protein n=1 Tax=unclassified Microcoleus TaxID=2642155 RepID=UPI002FCFAAF2